jgi:hypothetical protein
MTVPAPPSPNSSPSPSDKAVIEHPIEFAAIFTALLFFGGWQYARYYYAQFGVGIVSNLELDLSYYLIWASAPIVQYFGYVVCVVVVLALYSLVIETSGDSVSRRVRRATHVFYWPLVLLAFYSVAKVSEDLGQNDGFRDANAATSLLPRIKITYRNESIFPESYLYLGHHRRTYVLIPIVQFESIQKASSPRAVLLPEDQVKKAEVTENEIKSNGR